MATLKQQYQRNRRRIQAYVRRYNKLGIEFPKNIIPPIPKRITKASIRRLERINSAYLKSKGKGVDIETGVVISFLAGVRQAKKLLKEEEFHQKNEMLDRIIISGFKQNISIFNEKAQELLNLWLKTMINEYGEHDVAVCLENAERAGLSLNYQVVYDKDKLIGYIAQVSSFLPDIGEISLENLVDYLDEEYENV